jgi:ribonuclease P protein component
VVYRPTHAPVTRYGVLVSRRLGGAVIRNRTKRRCREIVRQPEMQYGAYDILILPQRAVVELPAATLRERLQTILDRLS